MINVFIQARMSSSRFPGKVLAPFNGKPIIKHVIERVAKAVPFDNIIVATSTELFDDPLVSYLKQLGVKVYRGPLYNVFERFQLCLKNHPCDWFFRVCADSPLLDFEIFKRMMPYADKTDIDIVTTTYPRRTFPVGTNLEMINSNTFKKINKNSLSSEEIEHLTKVFYNNPNQYKIIGVESGNPELALTSVGVDTINDLHNLEKNYKDAR